MIEGGVKSGHGEGGNEELQQNLLVGYLRSSMEAKVHVWKVVVFGFLVFLLYPFFESGLDSRGVNKGGVKREAPH